MSLKDYANEICQYSLLTREDEDMLAERIRNGDEEAVDTLVKHNLRLVMKIAQQFRKFDMFEDIVSVGNVGLIEAAKRFRTGKGAKFSTYASNWIKAKIRLFISKNHAPVSIPHSFAMKRYDARKEYEQSKMKSIDEFCHVHKYNIWYGRMLLGNISSVSLNATSGGDDGDGHEYLEAFDPGDSDSQDVCGADELAWIGEMLQSRNGVLDSREQYVLKHRFGMGCREQTGRQIAEHFNVTHQRIQQIEKGALKKLKAAIDEMNNR
ncbi:MAG: sigma-70 family RNA polymerase sigma factor [Bacteroidaceae bacterium]|nr:sigma-70 family RNA polymerase sigma factor [Bacteroidaceae bacterium]